MGLQPHDTGAQLSRAANSRQTAMRLRFFEGLRPLSRGGAAHNALAGVILASMNIPQVLGYARIASMPVVTGLFAARWSPW